MAAVCGHLYPRPGLAFEGSATGTENARAPPGATHLALAPRRASRA